MKKLQEIKGCLDRYLEKLFLWQKKTLFRRIFTKESHSPERISELEKHYTFLKESNDIESLLENLEEIVKLKKMAKKGWLARFGSTQGPSSLHTEVCQHATSYQEAIKNRKRSISTDAGTNQEKKSASAILCPLWGRAENTKE